MRCATTRPKPNDHSLIDQSIDLHNRLIGFYIRCYRTIRGFVWVINSYTNVISFVRTSRLSCFSFGFHVHKDSPRRNSQGFCLSFIYKLNNIAEYYPASPGRYYTVHYFRWEQYNNFDEKKTLRLKTAEL